MLTVLMSLALLGVVLVSGLVYSKNIDKLLAPPRRAEATLSQH